jgi:thiol-disulfide isomerase/thioredoxin
MKKQIISIMAILLLPAFGWAQGIVFEPEGNFAAAVAKAKQEKKPIFADFYTDWCGPCKQMTAGVFTREAVGEVFNRNFVNVKVNAEKGEGIELAKRIGVEAYPTMFFIDPETGRVIHAIVGYRSEEELLDEVRQLEQSGKYGGLQRMREEFAEGRSDMEFLVDYFDLLPRDDREQRSAVAERYLLEVPDATFKSEEATYIVFIGGSDGIMGALAVWNDRVMGRMLDLVAEKQAESETGFFSTDYNIGMVFSLELLAGRFVERAIERGDGNLLDKVLEFQRRYREKLGRATDGDTNIMSGRSIFFASPEMIGLQFMTVNRSDPARFRREVVAYMDSLVRAMPADSLATERAGGYYPWHASMVRNPNFAPTAIGSAAWAGDESIDHIIDWTNYYWRLMPNDKKTKQTVARWLNYACSINPYSAEGARRAAPLLVRVGRSDDAIANLERVIASFERFGFDVPQFTAGLRELIEDIKNHKI